MTARPQIAFDVRPLTGGLGAEIFGIDLAQPLDAEGFRAINQVLLDHGAIFFRDRSEEHTSELQSH